MKKPIQHLRHSLAVRLGLAIMFFVLLVFTIALGFLFNRSRQLVKQEAIGRATKMLGKTALRVTSYLNNIEDATHDMEWLVMQNLRPDSLLNFTHRVVEMNPDVSGCSITMEPDFFSKSIGNFSAYSIREGNRILTAREGDYDYYQKDWYRLPKMRGHACWIDPYDDYNAGTLSNSNMIASYSLPLRNAQNQIIGIISTDLSLPWLSKTISEEKPYPNSYSIMINRKGYYFVHPNPSKLFKHTILSGINPKEHPDIVTLGHEMLAGKDDYMKVKMDGQSCYVFYEPLPQTGWSIAIICPENDILDRYNHLFNIIIGIIAVGLLLILLFCLRTISHFIAPLYQLVVQSRHIASGHFDEHLPRSHRNDFVGQLQNSFVTMQESLDEHISQLQRANDEAEHRNQELLVANQLAKEAMEQKTAFIQDISHQIRTPLNIIQGFFNVVRDNCDNLSPEEKDSLTDTMLQNAISLRRMTTMLYDKARYENGYMSERKDLTNCNEVAREAIQAFNNKPPYHVPISMDTSLPDTCQIMTDRTHLFRIVCELLFNAKKYAPGSHVRLKLDSTRTSVRFIVEDNGPGIPAKDLDNIFDHFMKVNYFSEGLGLGLNLSRQIARQLGGELTLDPTYTSGCRFILEMPL